MLRLQNVTFQYTDEKPILKNIGFELNMGEHLCIMGESGSGKSTLLKVIYGLLDANEGRLFWNDFEILGPKYHLVPGMDFFKYVAQDFDLMPFTTVSENIQKFLSRLYPKEAETRTNALLEVIEMTDFANVKVKNLSGGQQQRVAIARALAKEPVLILLDEPFSQIDNFKKNSLKRRLFQYLKEKNIACIVATHDGNDALSYADKMMVIKEHIIIANDTPMAIYKHPKIRYVASLFDDVNEVAFNNTSYILYPHNIQIVESSKKKAIVTNAYFKGFYWLISVEFEHQTIFISHASCIEKNTVVCIRFETR